MTDINVDVSTLYSDALARAAIDGASISPSSVSTDELTSREQFNQPPITAPTNAPFTIQNYVHYVDQAPNSPFIGRGYHADYYFDPPYEGRNLLPQHSGDGTPRPTGLGAPDTALFVAVMNDYVFSMLDNPLTLYRSPYSEAFSSGSFTWTEVLQGQPGSSFQIEAGEYQGSWAVDSATSTMLVGEEFPDNEDPIIYRSTDNGATFSQVHQETDSGIQEYHCIANAPEPDRYIVTMGDGPADRRYMESLDGGQTWTRKQWGFEDTTQSVGVGFWTAQNGDRLMLFTEDRGAYRHGPFYVNYDHPDPESPAAKGLLTSPNPRQYYENDTLLEYAMWADDENGIIYITINDTSGQGGTRLYYLRGIGDHPNTLGHDGVALDISAVPSHDWLVNGKTRYPRLMKGR